MWEELPAEWGRHVDEEEAGGAGWERRSDGVDRDGDVTSLPQQSVSVALGGQSAGQLWKMPTVSGKLQLPNLLGRPFMRDGRLWHAVHGRVEVVSKEAPESRMVARAGGGLANQKVVDHGTGRDVVDGACHPRRVGKGGDDRRGVP